VLHLVLYALLAILVAGGLFLIAARFLPAGEQIAPPLRDEPPWDLPAGRSLQPEDVDSVRLPVALRGYRFAETDTLLDRLAGELRARDAEIARLRDHDVPNGDAPVDFSKPAEPVDAAEPPEPVKPAEPIRGPDAAADVTDDRS
jgi:DivIVA domain-containing protein